ncbi:FAD:protein FMN transferase [Rhizorhabdus sp. FW153]|uniref:FAD:protein FMN transferase n=1 Tax=Rhizorhabdus sp. FW153 TaxID=3400216 RepID=UPI003CFA30E8
MGTMWSVRYAAPVGLAPTEVGAAVKETLDRIIVEMSQWRDDSLISAFNRAPQGTELRLPADFRTVLDVALDVARRSDGAFDPTMGRLVDLAGFGPAEPADEPTSVTDALRCAGWKRLPYAGGRIVQPGGLALDFSGVAKGHAVDAVADRLAQEGVTHMLVEIGGELVGCGVRPDGQPWWVDLEAPPGLPVPPLRIALHGMAVATSGNYRRGNHMLDPATGSPIVNGVRSVSVLHDKAAYADAWATALTVLGPDAGLRLAEREALAARIVADTELLSPALREMLE